MVEILWLNVRLEAAVLGVDLTDGLLETLFERATDGHNLADRLHRRADAAGNLGRELGQVPARNFRDNVVERRLKARSRCLCHRIGQLGEGMSKRDLRGGVRKRVPSGLRREGAGATQATRCI